MCSHESVQPASPAPALRGAPRAFTAVELVVSMGIMSVLAVGISSAVLVSLRSVETSTSQSTRVRQAADVSSQMAMELAGALDVSERTPNAVTFSVVDRDQDEASEEVRYSWSGIAGDPLIRRYNDQPHTLIGDVHAFTLAYDLVPVPQPVTGSDLLFAGHRSSKDLSNYRIRTYDWAAQAFRVSLPAGATAWKLTRVAINCRQVGDPGGRLTVQLRSALWDGRPGSTVHCEITIPESQLMTAHTWHSIPLKSSYSLSPTAWYCLLFTGNTSDVCELRFHNKNVNDSSLVFHTTSSGGYLWSQRYKQAMLFDVYGIPVGGSVAGEVEMRLGTVRWQLQVGADPGNRIHAGVQTVNLPE